MSNKPTFSVIIPLFRIGKDFEYRLKKYITLYRDGIILIIVSDKKWKYSADYKFLISQYLTGKILTGPAEKRDIGIQKAKEKYCAFIDDDAYPDPAWLLHALKTFNKYQDCVAVGGPGVTPPDDTYLSQISGAVLESNCTSGKLKHRFISEGEIREVVDWPAYNLIVRTDILKKVGGYGSSFYGGEDTLLCMKLLKYGKIFYNPKMIVYHHRRPAGLPFFKQIYNVGLHRGYFFRKFPETSRSFIYFIPLILTIGFIAISFYTICHPSSFILYLSSILFFYFVAFLSVDKYQPLIIKIPAAFMIIFTHMAYASGFVKGLLIKKLSR